MKNLDTHTYTRTYVHTHTVGIEKEFKSYKVAILEKKAQHHMVLSVNN